MTQAIATSQAFAAATNLALGTDTTGWLVDRAH